VTSGFRVAAIETARSVNHERGSEGAVRGMFLSSSTFRLRVLTDRAALLAASALAGSVANGTSGLFNAMERRQLGGRIGWKR